MQNDSRKNISPSISTPKLVVIGELNIDLIMYNVNQLPEIGKERIAQDMTLTLGSSSAILASNTSMLGLEVGFIGRIGHDDFGTYAVKSLDESGVDTQYVIKTKGIATGVTIIYTFQNDRGMLTYPGAMEKLVYQDIPWDYLSQAQHLHLSSFYLQTGIRPSSKDIFKKAKELGLTTSLDTNWDPEDKWGTDILDTLDYVDVFLPNDQEAMMISGENNLEQALSSLSERAGLVVATCGSEGVKARQDKETYSIPGLPVVPVDAVGAGDSFNSGFLKEFINGSSIEECLYSGLLTGAYSTQDAGGTTAFKDMDKFMRFKKDMVSHLNANT
ncbi:MAG: carbohydrate kinase family protein [Balneolales bacterium]